MNDLRGDSEDMEKLLSKVISYTEIEYHAVNVCEVYESGDLHESFLKGFLLTDNHMEVLNIHRMKIKEQLT